jgi:hypothetical protein
MTTLMPSLRLQNERRAHRDEPGARHTVTTRRGEHLGFIDTTGDGSLIAFDRFSTPVGRYPAVRDAKRALTDVARGETRAVRTARVARHLAMTSGAIAAALLVSASALVVQV